MNTFRRLWSEDRGFIVSAELVTIATLLVIGLTVGLTMVRNQVVQELVDVGQAIGSLDQSYGFGGICKPRMAFTAGTCYRDVIDFCQAPNQEPGTEPGGICVRCEPRSELDGEDRTNMLEFWREFIQRNLPHEPHRNRLQIVREGLWEPLYQQWARLLRAEVLGSVTLHAAPVNATTLAPCDEPCVLSGQLAVWVDTARYDQFQACLLQTLTAAAVRRGEWSTAATPRPGEVAIQGSLLPVGSRCDGVMDILPDRVFKAGDWGTAVADLGKETVVLVNMHRDGPQQTAWAWFNVPRPENLLRLSMAVRIELLGRCDEVIGQQVVPLGLGDYRCPPGVEVLDVFNPHEGEFRTLQVLGAKNKAATAAAIESRQKDPNRRPEDLLVMIAPYLMLPNGGNPPQSYAERLLLPFTCKLTAQQVKEIKDIRCVVFVSGDKRERFSGECSACRPTL